MTTVGGLQVATPQQASASAKTIFTELGKAFGWDDKVVKYVSETLGASSGEEFALMFPKPEMVDTDLIKKCSLPDETHLVQAARVRRAIQALQQAMETEEVRKRKARAGHDLDDPIPQEDLDQLSTSFWRRHRCRWPPGLEPADSFISRLYK